MCESPRVWFAVNFSLLFLPWLYAAGEVVYRLSGQGSDNAWSDWHDIGTLDWMGLGLLGVYALVLCLQFTCLLTRTTLCLARTCHLTEHQFATFDSLLDHRPSLGRVVAYFCCDDGRALTPLPAVTLTSVVTLPSTGSASTSSTTGAAQGGQSVDLASQTDNFEKIRILGYFRRLTLLLFILSALIEVVLVIKFITTPNFALAVGNFLYWLQLILWSCGPTAKSSDRPAFVF